MHSLLEIITIIHSYIFNKKTVSLAIILLFGTVYATVTIIPLPEFRLRYLDMQLNFRF